MTYQEALTALAEGKKLKRSVWRGKHFCICSHLNAPDLAPWKKHPLVAKLIETNGFKMQKLDRIWLFSIPDSITPHWLPTEEDAKADDWKVVLVKPRTCKVCGKKFDYGDEQSPVFKDSVWNQILETYGFPTLLPITKEHPQDDTGYICYECAEKALGRKITKEDLKDVTFNEPFIKHYF